MCTEVCQINTNYFTDNFDSSNTRKFGELLFVLACIRVLNTQMKYNLIYNLNIITDLIINGKLRKEHYFKHILMRIFIYNILYKIQA